MATLTTKQQSTSIDFKDLSNTRTNLLYFGTLVTSVTLSIVGLSALS